MPEEERDAVMVGCLTGNEQLVSSRRPPPDKADCTIIVMVGLPGSGKVSNLY